MNQSPVDGLRSITSAQWIVIKDIFETALTIPEGDRSTYISEACVGNQVLEHHVTELLKADKQLSAFLTKPALAILAATPSESKPIFAPDQILCGRFRILRFIAEGGMGQVYEAEDIELGATIAVKTLRHELLDNPSSLPRFKEEVYLTRQIAHPGVCRVFDLERHSFGPDTSRQPVYFLTMELIHGETLETILNGQRVLTPDEARSIVDQVAEAVAAAHSAGIIHRDLKPGNIFVDRSASDRLRTIVTDFGLARRLQPDSESPLANLRSMTMSGQVIGTLAYMAPEQLLTGEATVQSDLYALGLIIYEIVTGNRAFASKHPFGELLSRTHQLPQAPRLFVPALSRRWECIILKCLQPDTSRRYQSSRDLVSDVAKAGSLALLEARASQKLPAPARILDRIIRVGRRHERVWWWMAGATVLLIALALVWHVGLRDFLVPAVSRERPIIVVGEFENHTGQSVLDGTLREMFSATLQQSPYISVFPPSRVADVLQAMGRPPSDDVDEKTGIEICQRAGLRGLISGSIARLGSRYTLVVRAQGCAGDNILVDTRTVNTLDDISSAVDSTAEKIRRKLGETKASLKDRAVPLALVTSRSLDAVRFYTLGKRHLYDRDLHAAVLMFGKALELDPSFAMAHDQLGITYSHLEQFDLHLQHVHKALLLANRVSEPEKLKISADYYGAMMDYDQACGFNMILAEIQPADPSPFINLGYCKDHLFDFDAAISSTRRALAMLPQSRVRINLAQEFFLKGETHTAQQLAEPLSREYADDLYAQRVMGGIQLSLGEIEEARKTFERMIATGGESQTVGYLRLADLALATGNHREAKKQLEDAIVASEKTNNAYAATTARLLLVETLRSEGDVSRARKILAEIRLTNGSPVLALLLGRSYAANGDSQKLAEVLHLLQELIREHSSPVLESFQFLLYAENELRQGQFSRAISDAHKAVTYYPSPFALETLARCYEAAGRFDEAAGQYELVIQRANQRSEGFDAPAFSKVVYIHYRLGVIYEKLNNNYAARMHLKRFLDYWSRPDSAPAAYRDAKRRLAVLEQKGAPTPAI